MKHRLFAALLCACSAHAAEGPYPHDLYLRGGFNGWGIDHQLSWRGKGVYDTEVQLSPGNHPFKIGHKDWSAEWVLDPSARVMVAAGQDYRMHTRAGAEGYLFVKQSASYRFSVDVSDARAPVLRVTRLEAPPAEPIDPHAGHSASDTLNFAAHDGGTLLARFSTASAGASLRRYAHSTSIALRDPGPQYTSYQESAGLPTVRTGSLAFDALFALAVTETKQNSVSKIKDGNYNGGAPVDCDCFETGEKWHYVWTRDLSYAADLGLTLLDPQRVRNSLDFKLSGYRPGVPKAAPVPGTADGLQIVQDTGSGGSWPVSTDRVSWAFGAEKALNLLPPAERLAFAERALAALSNTIETDRVAAFDTSTGLYTGEQSFLDWRDQSYAAWIVDDIASMASSRALSTNVAHYQALSLAARLAQERGDGTRAKRYRGWAAALKRAINTRLWLPDAGMYSSLTAGHLDGAPMHKFDWLGQSLAIVTGIASQSQARAILASYPHGPMGAPVIHPQQQGMPVYHNRAIWPFVTAYGLKAAAKARNVAVADAAYATLMRAAALNLSNMENLEWLSGQSLLLDEAHPELIGPVINSKRQLWSVGAYLGMVIENVFGVHVRADGLEIRPFITSRLRRERFGQASVIELRNLSIHGHRVGIKVMLPAASDTEGYYDVDSVTLNGAPLRSARRLHGDASIVVHLGRLRAGEQTIHRVTADPHAEDPAVFAPREPIIASLARAGKHVRLTIAPSRGEAATVYNIYRDGKLVAGKQPAGVWTDRAAGAHACYAVEAQFSASGNRSHHSVPRCVDEGVFVKVEPPLRNWGAPGERFGIDGIRIAHGGTYQLQLKYHNTANQINLGISGGVKYLTLKDAAGRVAASQVVQLPHARAGMPAVYSTPLRAKLKAGPYRLELEDFYNMSYLRSNSSFSAAGGSGGPSNRFDLDGVRLLRTR